MLRSLVLILLLVNAAFFAWSQGWLNDIVGVPPHIQHEPQRLRQQVNADRLIVVSAGGGTVAAEGLPPASPSAVPEPSSEAPTSPTSPIAPSPSSPSQAMVGTAAQQGAQQGAPPVAAASASPASLPISPSGSASAVAAPAVASTTNSSGRLSNALCVEAGPFNPAETAQVDNALRPLLPSGSWRHDKAAAQGLWLVYMGPYTDPDLYERKQTELRRIRGLNYEEVHTPANLAQGLSLGRFSRLEDAEAALNTFRLRGIRTARVVTLRPPVEVLVVRVPQASVQMQVSLAGVKLPQGKSFTACRS